MLEIDVNPNPLRTLTSGDFGKIIDGHTDVGDLPGLGVTTDLNLLNRYAVPN